MYVAQYGCRAGAREIQVECSSRVLQIRRSCIEIKHPAGQPPDHHVNSRTCRGRRLRRVRGGEGSNVNNLHMFGQRQLHAYLVVVASEQFQTMKSTDQSRKQYKSLSMCNQQAFQERKTKCTSSSLNMRIKWLSIFHALRVS